MRLRLLMIACTPLVLSGLAGCPSTSDIVIDAPDSAPADASQPITVTATPKFRGLSSSDGTAVQFSLDQGSFSPTEAMTQTSVETMGGIAQVKIYPPSKPGMLTLSISFQNPNQETVTQKKIITLKSIPPADAETIALGCEASALGALISNAPAMSLNCTLTLKSKAGDALGGGQATFYAEAGQVQDGGGQPNGTRRFIYSVAPGSAPPADVVANQTEIVPNTGDAVNNYLVHNANGRDYNPRDGVATVLVVVRAQEAFVDSNGNGVYDDGVDTFTDESEPFIDVDDDGQYNAMNGDKFLPAFDLNGNGTWDGGNGVYDADTKVGRSTHILWTGDPTLVAQPAANVTIPAGQTKTINVFLVDQNGNPPTGFGTSDNVQLEMPAATNIQVGGLVNAPLNADIGMVFDKTGAFVDFVRDANRFPVLRRFAVNVTDVRPVAERVDNANMTLTGAVEYSPFPPSASSNSKNVQLSPVTVTVCAATGSC